MSLDKLRIAARQHEQREEWRAAIDLYRQAIDAGSGGAPSADPALFNKVGDLEQRAGRDEAACEAWEQAAARYGEQGFFNNAIAICNKILRQNPSRLNIYLELARYQARKRVIYDVRQNLGVYHSQMTARGEGETANAALASFGREFASWTDLRRAIDELLGRESEEETPVATTARGQGDSPDRGGGLVFIDVADPRQAQPAATIDATPLEVVPTSFDGKVEHGGLTVEGLEATIHGVETEGDAAAPEGIIEFERSTDLVGDAGSVAGLVTPETASPDAVQAITLDGLESTAVELPPIETAAEVDMGLGAATGSGSDGIIFLEGTPGQPGADPLGQRAAAEAQLERGDRSAGIASLERALEGYQQEEDWARAWQVATELIQAEPRAIDRYQARVEVAARMRDRERLCQSYQELGDALVKEGANDKAVAVFRRVLELDETHAEARAALRKLAPEAPASETTADGFIDLGAMLIDDGPRTTRMRTETTTISDNEDETFREALAEFKRALDQNLPVEDHQTHYDLGVAFKEMGLLDEAISEFQKALRSPEGRLRTSEALGQAFYDQGRPAVAEAVLRAVEKGEEGDSEKIGVLYWLGRSQEAQGKGDQAVQCYQRVIAVDVGFEDAADRLTRIGSGQG